MAVDPRLEPESLATLVDSYQASGRYVLARDRARAALGGSDQALKKAIRRLVDKQRLAMPRRGFLVLVPLEYREAGAPPPSWFIDDLMKFHGQPYYVGLLSAAALHGAAHQQPQEFQVITRTQLRPAIAGRVLIRFYAKRHLERTPTIAIQTETGSMKVSTPEATALDLLRYAPAAGHLGNIATVLSELAERLEKGRLAALARADGDLPNAQRLGYLLDRVGAAEAARPLAKWIAVERPRYVALRPGHPAPRAPRDPRWRLMVNESVEADA